MPRIARLVAIGLPHHITQRGNYGQNVFNDDNDRRRYLCWIDEYSRKYDTTILAYCLMNNHVHFIAIPGDENSLAKTFNAAHMRYAQYFNKKIHARGHLWQGRFYSCMLDNNHLLAAARYIERNPVRAGIVDKPWKWKWSSTTHHIAKQTAPLDLGDMFTLIPMDNADWKNYIDTQESSKEIENIRKHTLNGRPLGAISFVEELEKKFGRKLIGVHKGRPRKQPDKMVAVPIYE